MITSNYFLHQQELHESDNVRYLGITINNQLSWNNHIDNICVKANMTLNFLFRNFKGTPKTMKELLYKSYVRPIIEYANIVWDPHTRLNIEKFETYPKKSSSILHRCHE